MKYQDQSLAGNIMVKKNDKTHVLNYKIYQCGAIKDDFHIDWGFVWSYLPPLQIIGHGKAEKKSPSDWLPPEEVFFSRKYFYLFYYLVFLFWGNKGRVQ